MHSILDPRTVGDLAGRLIAARRKSAGEAESMLVGVMSDALRECEIVAGSATREDLRQIGFTAHEIDAHLAAARDRAHRRQTRVNDTV